MAVNASAFYGTGIYGESEYGVINAEFTVTGVSGTGAVSDALTLAGDANFVSPSVQALGSTNPNLIIEADATHSITSVQGVGSTGSVGLVGVAIHQVTGVEGVGQNTVPTISGDANFAIPEGVEGTMFNGGAEGRPSTVIPPEDYGGGFGLTGTVNATLGFIGEANFTPEAAEVTGNVTTATISGDANFELPESTEGTGIVNTSDVAAASSTSVTGVEGTGATTTATIAFRYLAQAVEGTGEVTTATVTADANFEIDTVSASANVSDVTTGIFVTFTPESVEGTGEVATVSIAENAQPTFDSVSATASVGDVTVNTTRNVFQAADRNERRVVYVRPQESTIVYIPADKHRTVYVKAA